MKKKRRRYQIGDKYQEEEESGQLGERELLPGTTFSLHNDNRKTMVEIEGKLYNLVLTDLTLKDILREGDMKKVPHVRHLNPILQRSQEVQARRNEEAEDIHNLAKRCSVKNDKVTSLKKAMALGANVPEIIAKLMKEKEAALKAGDPDKAKKIRKQLRGLDYKRYINEK